MRSNKGDRQLLFVQVAIRFGANFVIDDRIFAKIGAVGRLDHGRPTAAHVMATGRVQESRPRRLYNQRAEQAVIGLFAFVAMAVKVVRAFGLIWGDRPFVGRGGARSHNAGRIRGNGGFSAIHDVQTSSVQMKAGRFVTCQIVAQRDAQTLALIHAQDQGLDGIALQTDGDGRFCFVLAGSLILCLFLADTGQFIFQHVHAPIGVVVQEAVQGDLDGDRDNSIGAHGGSGCTACRGIHGLLACGAAQHLAFVAFMSCWPVSVFMGVVADGD